MKTWQYSTEIPLSVAEYAHHFASPDLSFHNEFHDKKGHIIDVSENWKPLEIQMEDRLIEGCDASFAELLMVRANDIVNHKEFQGLEWLHRREEFRIPLPLPDYVLRHVYGPEFNKKGSLMKSDHFRTKDFLKDGSLAVEAFSRPMSGLLAGRFHVHLLFHVLPHPDTPGNRSIVNLYGRLHAQIPGFGVTKAIETFSLPFSKSLSRDWMKNVLEYTRKVLSKDKQSSTPTSSEIDGETLVMPEVETVVA